jgi:hypothetical protein
VRQAPQKDAQTQQNVCGSINRQECAPEIIRMRPGTVSTRYTVARSYQSVEVGNNAIADVVAASDTTFFIRAKANGITNFILFDDKGSAVNNVTIVVSEPPVLNTEISDPEIHTVEIHNRPGSLTGSTSWECSPTGCKFLNQTEQRLPTQVFEGHYFNTNR